MRACGWIVVLTLIAGADAGCIRDFDRSLLGEDECLACPIAVVDAAPTVTCAVHRDGRLWCGGSNDFGTLGVPGAPSTGTPLQVPGTWDTVATADGTTCAIDRSGALFCWGAGGNGELGLGELTGRDEPTRVGEATDWSRVDTGWASSCGIRGDGELHCAGWTASGRIGVLVPGSNALEHTRVPLTAALRSLSLGERHGCAIDVDSGLWCWGANGEADGEDGRRGYVGEQVPPQRVHPESRYLQIAAGRRHTCGIRSDRSLWCWGDNTSGQLGVPGAEGIEAVHVPAPAAWRAVSAGETHTCGIDTGGALYCWGDGTSGKLGTASETDVDAPARVGERVDWTRITAGWTHSCGATADGMIHCWGSGSHQQSGPAGSPLIPTLVPYE